MSAIKSFFEETFFVSGTEGIILLIVCIAAIVCTLVVIALAITVILSVKRRKREESDELTPPSQNPEPSAAPAEQTEPPAQTPAEAFAEGSEQTPAATPAAVFGSAPTEVNTQPPAATSAQTPAATSPKIYTRTESAIFVRSGTLYNKSFTAKLIQSPDELKGWYAELKNELLSYKKVKSRISWKRESFRSGRKNIVRFAFRGKTLCAYFALDPNEFDGTKYKVEAVEVASYADTSCMYRIKNERRVRYAKELIAVLMSGLETERIGRAAEDYYLPYEDAEPLIEKGLIKVINITPRAQTVAEEEPTGEVELPTVEKSDEETEEAAEEIAEEVAAAEVPDEEPTEENPVEETAEEEQPVEEETVAEATEEQPAEEVEEISEEVTDEEPTEEPAEKAEVEELSAEELDDVETYEEKTKDEDGTEVVGVMFRRRGRKVYWFDPDGKTWEKGEIALYITPTVPPQEVIVVDNAKISPSKLHLPLKPLHKAVRRSQTDNSHKSK